jgi:L-threonylcarbamoyladenylate synthase
MIERGSRDESRMGTLPVRQLSVVSGTSDTELHHAVDLLRTGGLVAFPTETVYGLGANALDARAVARVFEAKGRPHFDPLIVHIVDRAWLPRLAASFPEAAQRLADRFWPGPLTLVVPKTDLVPDLVTSGLPSVALRMPDHPVAQTLLRLADVPVAAPSANLFGRISPTTAEHVREQLGDRVDLILDGGPCRVGVESTVLQLTDGQPRLLRPGGVTLEEIESVIGSVEVSLPSEHPITTAMPSPGMLPQHYAPRTPLIVCERESALTSSANAKDSILPSPLGGEGPGVRGAPRGQSGLLTLQPVSDEASRQFSRIEILSPTGDLREAAANFFAALRRLDAAGLDVIIAHPFPNTGLGLALNDRLRRAATRLP